MLPPCHYSATTVPLLHFAALCCTLLTPGMHDAQGRVHPLFGTDASNFTTLQRLPVPVQLDPNPDPSSNLNPSANPNPNPRP